MKALLKTSVYILAALPAFALMSPVQAAAVAKGMHAPSTSFIAAGKPVSVHVYHGHKTILWMFSTWCPTCEASAVALAEKQADFAKYGVQVVVLENYQNGGYPGPSIGEFALKYAPRVVQAKNWTFGEATQGFAKIYNPKAYPDLYYLIGADGVIDEISGAPSATLDTILKFAKG